MTLTNEVTKNIIAKLIKGHDYRMEVVTIINAEFLQFAIDFFKQIVEAKLHAGSITTDWYKSVFLNEKPQGKPCGIEDFSLKSLRMRGNKSPAPPVRSAPRGGVLNPKRATPLIKIKQINLAFIGLNCTLLMGINALRPRLKN